jgi:hypothetical protein
VIRRLRVVALVVLTALLVAPTARAEDPYLLGVPPSVGRYLAIRAVDQAGNVGLPAVVSSGQSEGSGGSGPGGGGPGPPFTG